MYKNVFQFVILLVIVSCTVHDNNEPRTTNPERGSMEIAGDNDDFIDFDETNDEDTFPNEEVVIEDTYANDEVAIEDTYAKSVSQFGITWTFDKEYQVGQFANGDNWIVGPVNIINIDPPSLEMKGHLLKKGHFKGMTMRCISGILKMDECMMDITILH
jgi:hypothetical protein